jgi:hypothetical protein
LKTPLPVAAVNSSVSGHLPAVQDALRGGLVALPDTKRPGFYDIEVGDNWYYIHIPTRLDDVVYLVATARKQPAAAERLTALPEAS